MLPFISKSTALVLLVKGLKNTKCTCGKSAGRSAKRLYCFWLFGTFFMLRTEATGMYFYLQTTSLGMSKFFLWVIWRQKSASWSFWMNWSRDRGVCSLSIATKEERRRVISSKIFAECLRWDKQEQAPEILAKMDKLSDLIEHHFER